MAHIDPMGNKSHGNRIFYTRGFPNQIFMTGPSTKIPEEKQRRLIDEEGRVMGISRLIGSLACPLGIDTRAAGRLEICNN
jgi:hypothetical protein